MLLLTADRVGGQRAGDSFPGAIVEAGAGQQAGRKRLAWPVRLAIRAVAQIIAFLTANLSRFGLPARVRP